MVLQLLAKIIGYAGYKDSEKNKRPKEFERDVFYILRRILPLTERWGKIGERESDGMILFPDEEDNYFVASYDPKYSMEEYKLSTRGSISRLLFIISLLIR